MNDATLRPGIAVGYWKARNMPEPGALVGRQLEDVAALPEDLAALDDVGRVAHQGVGEGRLARAVGAHDRVDLALADGQVDPLEDLVLGRGDGRDAKAADDELLVVGGVGRSRGGQGSLEWCRLDRWSWRRRDARRHEVGEGHRVEGAGDRVADADPQDVDRAAGAAVAQRRVLGVVAWRRSSGRSGLRGRGGPRSS